MNEDQKKEFLQNLILKLGYYDLTIQDLIDFAKSQKPQPEPDKPQKKSNKK